LRYVFTFSTLDKHIISGWGLTRCRWSQFENVMAKEPEDGSGKAEEQGEGHDEDKQPKAEGSE
jgi:hypothetical protein